MRTTARSRGLATLTAIAMSTLALAACSPEDPADEGADEGSGDAYTELVASGPVADDAAVEGNEWASAVREAGVLTVGGTETSELFSLLDPTTGETRGFDSGIQQMLSQYILGEVNMELQQVTTNTREQVLESNTVDTVIATYSITPERAERVAFAGPYYSSQAGILVSTDTTDIEGIDDLAGRTVTTQASSTGVTLLEEEAPEAEILALPDHAQALAALQQGNADAYVIDQTLLMNAVVANDDVQIVGEPFGPEDPYGIGVNQDSDAVDFINTFLTEIEDSGQWADLWQLTIGDRADIPDVPTPPTPGDTGL